MLMCAILDTSPCAQLVFVLLHSLNLYQSNSSQYLTLEHYCKCRITLGLGGVSSRRTGNVLDDFPIEEMVIRISAILSCSKEFNHQRL